VAFASQSRFTAPYSPLILPFYNRRRAFHSLCAPCKYTHLFTQRQSFFLSILYFIPLVPLLFSCILSGFWKRKDGFVISIMKPFLNKRKPGYFRFVFLYNCIQKLVFWSNNRYTLRQELRATVPLFDRIFYRISIGFLSFSHRYRARNRAAKESIDERIL